MLRDRSTSTLWVIKLQLQLDSRKALFHSVWSSSMRYVCHPDHLNWTCLEDQESTVRNFEVKSRFPSPSALKHPATLGYRLFARRAQSSKVGCLVLAGNDFPDTIRKRLKDWNMKLVLNVNSDKLSTRGLLEYEDSTFGRKCRVLLYM